MQLNDNLLTARKAAGATQAQVAAEIGCSATEISSYEKGREPRSRRLGKLGRLFGVDLDTLMYGSEADVRAAVLAPAKATEGRQKAASLDAAIAKAEGRGGSTHDPRETRRHGLLRRRESRRHRIPYRRH